MLVITGVILTVVGSLFYEPILYLFGAVMPHFRLPEIISKFTYSVLYL